MPRYLQVEDKLPDFEFSNIKPSLLTLSEMKCKDAKKERKEKWFQTENNVEFEFEMDLEI